MVSASVAFLLVHVYCMELFKKFCNSSAVGCKKYGMLALYVGSGIACRGRGSQPVERVITTLASLSIAEFHHLFKI